MRETPAYYLAKIIDLQESQKKIYENWLERQHQIFARYMKEFENMLQSSREKQVAHRRKWNLKKRTQPKKRKIPRLKVSKPRRR